jgi:His-Xaa-Ser system protein HxsD
MQDSQHSPEVLSFDVAEAVYSRDALLRTCYWFTDRCYVFITRTPGTFTVHLQAKAENTAPLSVITGEFQNALLDYQLRHDIDQQTGKIRELLVAKAVAEAGALDDPPPGTPNDPVAEHQPSLSPLVTITRSS